MSALCQKIPAIVNDAEEFPVNSRSFEMRCASWPIVVPMPIATPSMRMPNSTAMCRQTGRRT